MGLNPEIGAALGAMQLVPGLGSIATVGQLAVSVFGDDELVPRIQLPDPFIRGSFLWGVSRSTFPSIKPQASSYARPRNERSFIVRYSEQAAGGAPADYARPNGLQELGLPQQLGISKGPLQAGFHVTDQVPLYSLTTSHTGGKVFASGAASGVFGEEEHPLTAADALWKEALRREAPERLVGTRLFLGRGWGDPRHRQLVVHSVETGPGDWSPFQSKQGGEVSPAVEAWLEDAPLRLQAQANPVFDYIDTRTWNQVVEDDRQTRAGLSGNLFEKASDANREAWDATQAEREAAYLAERETWLVWREQLVLTQEREIAFLEQQKAWDQAWTEAIALGATIDQASAIAGEVFESWKQGSGVPIDQALNPAPVKQAGNINISPEQAAIGAGLAALLLFL